MNDTTRRFLNSVLQRVPESRIVELRLFPALRQGGIESGVAVLAMETGFDKPPEAVSVVEDLSSDVSIGAGAEVTNEDQHEVEVVRAVGDDTLDVVDTVEARSEDDRSTTTTVEQLTELVMDELERETALEMAREGMADEADALEADFRAAPDEVVLDSSDVVMADAAPDEAEESIALGDILALPSPEAPVEVLSTGPQRLAILCARYKLIFKGPDRGKYDLEIMHQADAPLETLDRVIAGVVRRSGEETEPARYTAQSLREALDAPAWAEA